MASWQENESVRNATETFNSQLNADPFEGAAVMDALAGVIDSVDRLPQREVRGVSPAEFGRYILERINGAASAAEGAGAASYSQLFAAQAEGWKATMSIEETAKTPQVSRTDTTKKSMGDKKS